MTQREDGEQLTDAETNAGNTIGNGTDPGQLGLVDGEVGAGGALKALRVEDLLLSGRRKGLNLNESDDNSIVVHSVSILHMTCKWSCYRLGVALRNTRVRAEHDFSNKAGDTGARRTSLGVERRPPDGHAQTYSSCDHHVEVACCKLSRARGEDR